MAGQDWERGQSMEGYKQLVENKELQLLRISLGHLV